MVFSSFVFLGFFLPIVLILYFGARRLTGSLKLCNWILLAASLLFYAWGEPVCILALLFTALVDYVNGRRIGASAGTPRARRALISSLIINLAILFLFKYLGFTIDTVNGILGTSIPSVSLSMPIGISFYTFQSLSYVIDLYRGKAEMQKSFLNYLLYVSMFPQLVAGPIVRYVDVERQIQNRHATIPAFAAGVSRFCAGMGKKVLLANSAGAAASILLDGDLTQLSAAGAWLGVLLFTFQIYFDFSGYSDMAIGMGKMFGFEYKENFNYPYISTSITDFWRRWHISLSSFFRDYVYIPLGGNRHSQLRNILAVWFLTGLWHGASWNFILWGMYYGLLLLAEKFLMQRNLLPPAPIRWVYTMIIVVFGWGIFYFTDFNSLQQFTRVFFFLDRSGGLYDLKVLSVLMQNVWLLAVMAVASTPLPKRLFEKVAERFPAAGTALQCAGIPLIMLLCFLLLVGQSYNPFLYFRF